MPKSEFIPSTLQSNDTQTTQRKDSEDSSFIHPILLDITDSNRLSFPEESYLSKLVRALLLPCSPHIVLFIFSSRQFVYVKTFSLVPHLQFHANRLHFSIKRAADEVAQFSASKVKHYHSSQTSIFPALFNISSLSIRLFTLCLSMISHQKPTSFCVISLTQPARPAIVLLCLPSRKSWPGQTEWCQSLESHSGQWTPEKSH